MCTVLLVFLGSIGCNCSISHQWHTHKKRAKRIQKRRSGVQREKELRCRASWARARFIALEYTILLKWMFIQFSFSDCLMGSKTGSPALQLQQQLAYGNKISLFATSPVKHQVSFLFHWYFNFIKVENHSETTTTTKQNRTVSIKRYWMKSKQVAEIEIGLCSSLCSIVLLKRFCLFFVSLHNEIIFLKEAFVISETIKAFAL